MRKTYRSHGGSREYWQQRWDQIPADAGVLNLDRYPGKYAERVMQRVDGEVLEAGCGAGRVLLHYHRQGRKILGMDFIASALDKIRDAEPDVPLQVGDIMDLPFEDGRFAAVLAFGLYHNLESGAETALRETRRVLSSGGLLCASVRCDNLQNRMVDWLADRNNLKEGPRNFHKANYRRREFTSLLERAGFAVETFEFVENMPFLYKFAAFRHRSHRRFDEHRARAEGYRFSTMGRLFQKTLVGLWPASFCNIMVIIATAK